MLPKFPEFKKVELSDKKDIEKITSQYQPYSDFNFVSMWSWDVEEGMRISEFHGNLIVKFTDYITADPFLTFLGQNKVEDTVDALLTFSDSLGIEEQLKLLPEISIKDLDRSKFIIEEDRNHFDYILSLEKLADYEASHMRDHYNFNRRFLDEHGEWLSVKALDLHDATHRKEVSSLTTIWMKNKVDQNKSFLSHLEDAVVRYLNITSEKYHDSFISIGIYKEDKLVAFTINELVDQDYSICHFMKGDNSYKGIYSHLITMTCQEILKTGRKYINFEQDLGLKNLRQAKNTYEPVHFLKKYNLRRI